MAGGNKLTKWILAALVLGIVVGTTLNYTVEDTTGVVSGLGLVTTTFLRLIKMIIGPLVFATLAVGIAKMGDLSVVGRVGLKSMAWFLGASLVSLSACGVPPDRSCTSEPSQSSADPPFEWICVVSFTARCWACRKIIPPPEPPWI